MKLTRKSINKFVTKKDWLGVYKVLKVTQHKVTLTGKWIVNNDNEFIQVRKKK